MILQQIGKGDTFRNFQIALFCNTTPFSVVNKCRNVKYKVVTALLLTIQAFRHVTQSESSSKYGHVSEQPNAFIATLTYLKFRLNNRQSCGLKNLKSHVFNFQWKNPPTL